MTTTPRLWKPQTQVNTADSGAQTDGQIAATHDGGYVVIWHSFNFTIGQRYDSAGNKLSGEVITSFSGGEQPAAPSWRTATLPWLSTMCPPPAST